MPLPNGGVDRERMQHLIALPRPITITFHRAFDMCVDPENSLDELIELAVNRLLTYGQKSGALEDIIG